MLAVRTPLPALTSLSRFAAQPTTDAELLGRFVADRDEDAFAELVRRHGPTILTVCRRVTGNRDDADDAFQATLLALARKAGLVRPGSTLGGWLYGVAIRAARKALARACRRRSRESPVAVVPDMPARPVVGPDPDEARAVLEAVAGLSDAYRSAVVLCELEGRSRAAAARELGIPEGTLSSRLGAARRVLEARLRDRGFGASVLAGVAVAAASPTVAAEARRLVRASAFPSQDVEKLMEAAMHTTRTRWGLTTAVVVMVAGLVMATDPPTRPGPEPAAAPKAVVEKADTSRLIFATNDEVRYFTPEGREVGRVTAEEVVKTGTGPAEKSQRLFKPVGRTTLDGRLPLNTRSGFHLLGFGPPVVVEPVKDKNENVLYAGKEMPEIVAWSADGNQAIAVETDDWMFLPTQRKYTLIDVRAGTRQELSVPSSHEIMDWSADRTWFLTVWMEESLSWGGKSYKCHLCRVTRDGKNVTELPAEPKMPRNGSISPDGKRVAYARWASGANAGGYPILTGFEVVVLDLTTGEKKVVVSEPGGEGSPPEGNFAFGVRWSPDGARLAYGYNHFKEKERKTGFLSAQLIALWSTRVRVCNADGTGNQAIFMREKIGEWNSLIREQNILDWRYTSSGRE
jgi:RNA polymerase sigma factor (sigma-70 family)